MLMMKPFRFQQFNIQQSSSVFRVGTDGVLLGALATVAHAHSILEIGSGTGLISLMLAQRNLQAQILALDIDENASQLTQLNFSNSIFSDRLQNRCQDFNTFHSETFFDLIVSNPPYFDENSSVKDVLARQKISLDFEGLISNSAKYLSQQGRLSLVIPYSAVSELLVIAEKNQLFCVKIINIFGIADGEIKRAIIEFSKSLFPKETLDFIIEKSPRKYSDQYLDATKTFHVFGNVN